MQQRLPKDAVERAQELVRRSQVVQRQPMPSAPQEVVDDLSTSRAVRAGVYASMEDLTDRVRSLSEEMDSSGVIVDVVDDDDEISLVHHIGLAEGSLGGEDEDIVAVPTIQLRRAVTG